MIDYNKELVSVLTTILPTHYEMTLTADTTIPCISYMELTNIVATEPIGATIGYSNITYQVKVWANNIADIQNYSLQLDAAMRSLGFKRMGSRELYDNSSIIMQKVFTYEALATENY